MTVFAHYLQRKTSSFVESLLFSQKRCTVFLTGGFPLLLGNAPAPVEVYNDLDSGVLYFFETLRNCTKLKALHKILEKVPSFKEYNYVELMKGYRDTNLQDVNRIALWYICARALLQKHLKKIQTRKLFRRVGDYEVFKRNGKAAFLYRELSDIDAILPEIHGRLFRMQLEHYPIEKVIRIYDDPDTIFIVDLDHIPTIGDWQEGEVEKILKTIKGDYFMYSLRSEKCVF